MKTDMKYSLCLMSLLCLLAGCQQQPKQLAGYQTLPAQEQANSDRARELNGKGVKELEKSDLDQAEKTFKDALTQDLFFGPAHNNLGIVYFRQKKFYAAAWEFQYAVKLMPGKSEPRNNLGMVFENVGKMDEATKCYEEALKLEPEDVQVMANLARLRIRTNLRDDRTRQLLNEVILRDQRPEWVNWAREKLALMPKDAASQPVELPVSPSAQTVPSRG
jgi:Flp pilus assembly protein TadD